MRFLRRAFKTTAVPLLDGVVVAFLVRVLGGPAWAAVGFGLTVYFITARANLRTEP